MVNYKLIYEDEDEQKKRTTIDILPFISLASGIYPIVISLLLMFDLLGPIVCDEPGLLVNISVVMILVLVPIGFICGLYYLTRVKTGHFGLRICAMLGTALSALWICMILVELWRCC